MNTLTLVCFNEQKTEQKTLKSVNYYLGNLLLLWYPYEVIQKCLLFIIFDVLVQYYKFSRCQLHILLLTKTLLIIFERLTLHVMCVVTMVTEYG